jgi:hypothetical protein
MAMAVSWWTRLALRLGSIALACSIAGIVHAQAAPPAGAPAQLAPPTAQPAPSNAQPAAPEPVPAQPVPAQPAPPAAQPAPVPPPPPPPPPQYQYPRQAQPYDYESAPEPPRKRRSAGLMIAGLATLGGSYLFSVLVGLELAKADSDPGTICTNCDKADLFYIPIAGPWLFLPDADGSDGKIIAGIMGLAQATGVVLSIVGIAKFASSGEPDANAQAPRLTLGLAPTPSGAHARLNMQF